MKKRNLTEQTFTQGAAVLLISTVLVKLIGAFFKIPLSSDYCLGDLGFGYFASVYDLYVPIYTLAISGFPVAISKVISDYSGEDSKEKAGFTIRLFKRLLLFLGILGFIAIILLTKPFVLVTDKSGNTAYTMLAMAPAMFFCCLSSVYRGAFEGYKNMTPTAISNIIEAISKVALGFTAALITVKLTNNLAFGAASAMLGIAIGTALSWLYLKLRYNSFYKDYNSSNLKNTFEYRVILKNMVAVSLPIVFTSLVGSLVSLIDALTVKWLISAVIENNSAAILNSLNKIFTILPSNENLPTFLYGLRSKAYTLYYLAPTFTAALGMSALPMISSAFSSKNYKCVKCDISSLIKFSSVISFPVAFGLIFAGKPVMTLLYGDTTALAGGIILTIFGFATATAGITMSLATVLQGIGKQNTVFINFAIGLVLKLIFNIIFISIPLINIFGSALSTVVCYFYIIISLSVTLKKSGFMPPLKNTVVKPFFAAFICGITAFTICTFSNNKFTTVLAILSAVFVYAIALLIFKPFVKEDFIDLPMGKKLIKMLKLPDFS